MVFEQLAFLTLSITLFIFIFVKMIRNSSMIYIIVLLMEAIGLLINFLEVLFGIELNAFLMILKYVFSIILPIAVIIIEKKGTTLAEKWDIFLSRLYMHFGRDDKAKKILLELASKYPENYKAHQMLAQVYENAKELDKAIDEYVQAIEINKHDYDSYFKVANLLNTLNKKDESMQMLYNLINKNPEYYQASILLGELLIEKEMYKDAVNILQDALMNNSMNYDINYNLGIAYTMLNDFQNAKKYYEKAAMINALSYNSKYSLAEIAMIYRNMEEAEQLFLQAAECEELSADAYCELSKIYMIKGDKETAIKYMNVALDTDPKRIKKKLNNETIFIPILGRIAIDINKDINIKQLESKLKPKEIKSKEHLEEMFELTRNLSYKDFQNTKKSSNSGKVQEKEIEEDEYQKEKQD